MLEKYRRLGREGNEETDIGNKQEHSWEIRSIMVSISHNGRQSLFLRVNGRTRV